LYKRFHDNTKWRKAHSKAYALLDHKHAAKQRGLDFIALNEPFENSVGHHIDEELVVYVPQELHASIRHSIRTGKNMQEMNDKVFAWLELQLGNVEKV
jgi:hypothetical protein